MIYNLKTLEICSFDNEVGSYLHLCQSKEAMLKVLETNDHSQLDEEFFLHKGIRYEEAEGFDLICVWKNLCQKDNDNEVIYIVLNQKEIHILAEPTYEKYLLDRLATLDKEKRSHPGHILYYILLSIIKDYQIVLERIAQEIEKLESRVMDEANSHNHSSDILHYRKELLQRERHYEQVVDILDDILEDNNEFYSEKEKKRFSILRDRMQRMDSHVISLLDYVIEIRESYQSALDIKQNKLMGVFTVISTIFLPLTLLVGWYGMNFQMPEFNSRFSYPIVIVVSILIVVFCICFFKKKKWF